MNSRLIRYSYMLVFTFGFLVISQPVILAFIRTELEFSDTQIGAVFAAGALNGVFSALLIGYLAETRGFSFIVRWALGLVLAASLLYAMPAALASFWTVLSASFFFMLGLSGCFFAGNSIIAAVCEREQARYLNYTHLFYCLGSIISPPVMTRFHRVLPFFSSRPVIEVWRLNFGVNVLLVLICAVWAMKLEFPPAQSREPLTFAALKIIVRNPLIYLLSAVLATYIVADLSLCNWMVRYLEWSGLDVANASLFLSGYFFLMALGRYCGGRFLTERATNRALMACLAVLPFSLAAGFYLHGALIPLNGLFFAIIFPTMLGKAYREIRYRPYFSVGIVLTVMSVFYTVSQTVTGALNDRYSVGAVLPAMTVGCSSLAACCFIAYLFWTRRHFRETPVTGRAP